MSTSVYAEHLKQAVRQGLEINPKLERRQVSGVWGMYTTGAIAEGELLARFPKSALLQPDATVYEAQVSPSVRMIHAAAKARQQGAASPFAYLFDLHEPLAQMKQYSTFFYGDSEFKQLKKLSPPLAETISHENMRWQSVINALLEFDESLDADTVITTVLNFSSRGIGSSGFVPVLDCFNHSCAKGSFIDGTGHDVKYVARVAYQPGEQVYVFYGWLDLYDHAIHYNYYDGADVHFIRYGCRESVPLLTAHMRQLHQLLSQKYATRVLAIGGHHFFQFQDVELLLGALGPTAKLQQLFVDYGVRANEFRSARAVMRDTMQVWLDALDQGNSVDLFKRKSLPVSMSRFFDVLKKEKSLVRDARQWLVPVS